jgi:SAM-dependent methyltransferase
MDLRKFRALSSTWEAFGDTDPMFGVLSDPARQGGKWNAEEFFASGRVHVERLFRTLDDVRASYERGACLDFGCGVGRLTLPLSESFARTVGVDVAQSMIETARRNVRPGDRCEFIVNRDPDLALFPDATFDVVHSCLVLQHILPAFALQYVREFFRVAKPGGLVVFQLPSETISQTAVQAAGALPDSSYAAGLVIVDSPERLAPSQRSDIGVTVTNNSDGTWRHDIPAGRHICLGNHWLLDDGSGAIQDDGRALLPQTMAPGDRVEMTLGVQAPERPGRYLLEVDLVQEHVAWFARKGSRTARAIVTIDDDCSTRAAEVPGDHHGPTRDLVPVPAARAVDRIPDPARRTKFDAQPSLIRRIVRKFRRGDSSFEMHVVPRPDVEQAIAASGGRLLRAADDNAAGPGWLSYTYVCRRLPRSGG